MDDKFQPHQITEITVSGESLTAQAVSFTTLTSTLTSTSSTGFFYPLSVEQRLMRLEEFLSKVFPNQKF